MVFGSIFAAANGIAMPMFAFIFGEMTDAFSPNATSQSVVDNAST